MTSKVQTRLVWSLGQTVEIKIRFQIPLTCGGQGIKVLLNFVLMMSAVLFRFHIHNTMC